MKKAYFITYLSAAVTCLMTMLFVKKTARKYGQPSYNKKHITLSDVLKGAETIYNTIDEIIE